MWDLRDASGVGGVWGEARCGGSEEEEAEASREWEGKGRRVRKLVCIRIYVLVARL